MSINIKVWKDGEELATQYLKNNGYIILERNYKNIYGEIDIIVRPKNKKDEIIFVEVKAKTGDTYGTPAEMVTEYKLRKLEQVASGYLVEKGLDLYVRFDVIEVLDGKLNHLIAVQ